MKVELLRTSCSCGRGCHKQTTRKKTGWFKACGGCDCSNCWPHTEVDAAGYEHPNWIKNSLGCDVCGSNPPPLVANRETTTLDALDGQAALEERDEQIRQLQAMVTGLTQSANQLEADKEYNAGLVTDWRRKHLKATEELETSRALCDEIRQSNYRTIANVELLAGSLRGTLNAMGAHGPCEENSCRRCTVAYDLGVKALKAAGVGR